MKSVRHSILISGFVLAICLTITSVRAQVATHLVISEVLVDGVNESSASNNDEFVEIYNPTSSSVDVSGWTVDYRSAAGSTFNNKFTFAAGTSIPSHRYFLVGGGGVATRDNSSASILMGLGNTGGAVFLRNSGQANVDLFGWGSAAAGNYEGGAPAVQAQGISFERKAKLSSSGATMAVGGVDEFEGNGYDSDNNQNDFVPRTIPQPQNSSSPAEPTLTVGGNGSGTGSIAPTYVFANSTSAFTISIAGDGTHTLDSVIVILPHGWTWAQSAGSISLGGAGLAAGVATVSADTIFVGKGAITKTDTGKITISSYTAPASGLTSTFVIKTSLGGGAPIQIASSVVVAVLKLVSIVDLHINDSQGVPVAPFQLGATVTVSGIISGDFSATSTNIFVQDATGGVCIFRTFRSFNYQVGDSVTVTGTLTQFRGLVEISLDTTKYVLHSSGHLLPDPFLVTAFDVNETFHTDDFTEPNEGRLVRINNVTYSTANGTVTDATGTTDAFIPNTWTIPAGTFDLIGVLKQYKPGTPAPGAPFLADYEIDPRTQSDIILHAGPAFTVVPFESNMQATSVDINANTVAASTEVVKFGLTTSYTDSVTSSANTTHKLTLSSLKPATVYHYQVIATDSSASNATGDGIFISGATSSDSLRIYFNHSVSYSLAQSESAKVADLSKVLIYRIGKAQYSIDMCTYSFSGTVGSTISTALLAARIRGVRIRVIGEHDNEGATSAFQTLKNGGVTVIDDAFDVVNAGNGLMHNKFYVIDHRDTSSSRVDWVLMGSWNATDPGTNDDAQNLVEIQNRSLAEAYTLEFNEMWGSSGDSPNQAASRFGIRKSDNTPHRFLVGGTPIELYFSPSDRTTSKINAVLSAATSSINICMLTFTRDDLEQTLVAKKTAGKKVRIVMDNNSDTGNQFANLTNAGIDVHLKGAAVGGLLHHKYAVIDADNPLADNIVVTGSHNWSSAAESANNENTLIIHSKRVANLYMQEFKQRYIEAGGVDNITLAVRGVASVPPTTYALAQNYPNPFNPSTHVQFSVADERFVSLKVYDILGREVSTLVGERMHPGTYVVEWNAAQCSSGMYFVRFEAGSFSATRKVILMK